MMRFGRNKRSSKSQFDDLPEERRIPYRSMVKLVVIIAFIGFIIITGMTATMIFEHQGYSQNSVDVKNSDTRVFTIAYVDHSKREILVLGKSESSDAHADCRLKYSEEYTPTVTGNLNVSVDWEFNCVISGEHGGGVGIDVRLAIFDSEGYELYFCEIYHIEIGNNETDISGSYSAFVQIPTEGYVFTTQMPTILLPGTTYNIGVNLRVHLYDISSIHGRVQDNPAILKIQNLTMVSA